MKVGYFVETPVEHNLTGGSRSFLGLLEQLVPMGVEPFVVVHEPWALTEELERRGIPFITTKMYRPFVGTTNKAKFYRTKYLIKTLINNHSRRVAGRFFRDYGVQLIHINSQFCGIVGAQVANDLHIPFLYHIREFLDTGFSVRFFNEKKADSVIGRASRIIGISKDVVDSLQIRFPQTRVSLVYNGIDYARYENCGFKKFNDSEIRFTITGRVTDAKNQLEAVKAIEKSFKEHNKRCRLIIIGFQGKDPYEIALRDYIKKKQIEDIVTLVPFIDNPEVKMQKSDVALICSRSEAFGRVTIESMMCGLLVIGSNIKATQEIIEDGIDGLLYPLGKIEELTKRINWVFDHRSEASMMAEEGRKKAIANFSIQKTAKKIIDIYKETVE